MAVYPYKHFIILLLVCFTLHLHFFQGFFISITWTFQQKLSLFIRLQILGAYRWLAHSIVMVRSFYNYLIFAFKCLNSTSQIC